MQAGLLVEHRGQCGRETSRDGVILRLGKDFARPLAHMKSRGFVHAMNARERVLAVFEHKIPDRVPHFEQGVASGIASEILGRPADTGGGGFRRKGLEAALAGPAAHEEYMHRCIRDWCDLVEALDFDAVVTPWAGAGDVRKRLDENTYLLGDEASDDWEIVRFDASSDTLYAVDSAERRGGLERLEEKIRAAEREHGRRGKPSPSDFWVLVRILERFRGKRAIGGPSGIAAPMRSPWLEAIAARPDLIRLHLEMQADSACDQIEVLAGMGVDFIWGGGDLAWNGGPIYSPGRFRELMLPPLKRIAAKCRDVGLPYFFRTDGLLWPIADILFGESGVHGYGEIDAQAGMDIAEIRQRFPALLLWGNVDCAGALVGGTPEQVKAEAIACMEKAATGHILGSSNVIHAGVPVGNFLAMVEARLEYGPGRSAAP